MYILLIFILACLLGWLLWRRLCRTRLAPFLRLLLALLFAALVFILLFWASVYIALFLSQWNALG